MPAQGEPEEIILPGTYGVRVAVYDHGGPGPALILAHATGLHARVWDPVVARLRGRFRCLAVDLRAHGDSGRPAGGSLHWSGFAEDVLAVVDGLDLEAPFGAGHSCGGAALLLAAEARPRTFAGLWCYEPIVPTDSSLRGHQPDNPLAQGARRRRRAFASRQAAYDNYASKPPFDRVSPEALRAYVDHGLRDLPDGTVELKCSPEDEAEVFAHGGTHDAYARLDRVSCPVTLCYGGLSQDTFALPGVTRLSEKLSRSRVVEMPGLGHFGPLEDPDAVAGSLAASLGGGVLPGVTGPVYPGNR